MTLRITDLHQAQSRIGWIGDNRSRTAHLERNIATGRRIHQPSDDPTAASRLMRHDIRLSRVDQYGRNIGNARLLVGAADQAVQSASNNLNRAKTLTVQAGNSILDVEQRAAVSADIRAIREELLVIANGEAADRPIFAGTANAAEVYDAAGTYLGDTGTVDRTIDKDQTITVGEPGPNVFGASNAGDPLNGSVFEMLTHIADAIDANNTPVIRDGIEAIDRASARIGAALGRIGARSQQLDVAELRQGGERATVESNSSELRDTNVVEAIVQLRSAQASYEASLSATSRAMSRSLLDFLR